MHFEVGIFDSAYGYDLAVITYFESMDCDALMIDGIRGAKVVQRGVILSGTRGNGENWQENEIHVGADRELIRISL